jgi:hypothetical protein
LVVCCTIKTKHEHPYIFLLLEDRMTQILKVQKMF